MSAHNTPTDVGAVLRQRWALGVVAVVTAVIAAAVTQLVVGDAAGLAVPVIVAALIGLLLGVVAIVVAEAVDGTIRAPHQLVKLTSAPNLGVVPRHQVDVGRPEGVTMFSEPDSVEAEGYRSAFTALEFVLRSSAVAVPGAVGSPVAGRDADAAAPRLAAPGKIVLVTSARPGEGKSSVAANLAAAAALAGRRVVLVDADLRKPQVHRLLRLENDAGLSTMLTGEAKGFSAVQRLESLRHLVVLSGGPPPPDPAELLASPRLGAALTSMAAQADLLIVDSPPVLAVTDPTLIAQQCDATIMVATAGASDRREWAEALSRLGVVDADVVGTVLIQPDSDVPATAVYQYAPGGASTEHKIEPEAPESATPESAAPEPAAPEPDAPEPDAPEPQAPDVDDEASAGLVFGGGAGKLSAAPGEPSTGSGTDPSSDPFSDSWPHREAPPLREPND